MVKKNLHRGSTSRCCWVIDVETDIFGRGNGTCDSDARSEQGEWWTVTASGLRVDARHIKAILRPY